MKTKKILSGMLAGATVLCSTCFPVMAQESEHSNPTKRAITDLTCEANSEHTGAEIGKAFDGNRSTIWDAAWEDGDKGMDLTPIHVDVTFDTPKKIVEFVYTPRQDDNPNGQIVEYNLKGKTEDGQEVVLVENGTWENNHSDKQVPFDTQESLKSVSLDILNGSFQNTTKETAATAAEFTFYENVCQAGINTEAMVLTVGQKKQLNLTGISGTETIWTSSNSDVVSVDAQGNVIGGKEGTATVTGKTELGETASCEISVSAEKAPALPGKILLFEDNFNGETLDTTKWNNWCVDLDKAKPFRYGNSPEVAVHPDNAYVKDGTLRLLASKEDTTFDGQTSTYRSGMIHTKHKFEETYGYVEAMLKIPNVPGSNPAVWTMPAMDENGFQWGDKDNFGAEIDILERPHPEGAPEHAGLTEKYWITMHYDNYEYTNHKKYHVQPTIKNPYKWHKFGMEWGPKEIKFMLDDQVVAVQDKDVPNTDEIFILSYGLGGWIGKIADELLPAEMEVDYVRWYKDIHHMDSTVTLDQKKLEMKKGSQQQLTATITPEGTDFIKRWESSDENVATIDENGTITAVNEGVAYINLVTEKNRTASCKVIVKEATIKTGWQKIDGTWYYYDQTGTMATGWQKIGGTWYYLKDSGAMATGWQKIGGTWYYLKDSGAMVTGWLKLGGTWYYLKDSGAMATGWQKIGGTWYYLKDSGAMATGWLKLGGTWYYLKDSGAMATGWLKLGGTWYYLKDSGAMATGWLKIGKTWYYLKDSGAMATGWQKIGGTWYYLKNSGAMARKQWINGYYVNASGAWVK